MSRLPAFIFLGGNNFVGLLAEFWHVLRSGRFRFAGVVAGNVWIIAVTATGDHRQHAENGRPLNPLNCLHHDCSRESVPWEKYDFQICVDIPAARQSNTLRNTSHDDRCCEQVGVLRENRLLRQEEPVISEQNPRDSVFLGVRQWPEA